MDQIEDVMIVPSFKSPYVKPFSMQYKQNGKRRIWDLVSTHDSVAILLYHTERRTFIIVKQFRPAVYINRATVRPDKTVDTKTFDGTYGLTYELCAGIIDKDLSPEQTAKDEVLEECGYNVPLDQLHRITSFRSGVGIAGSKQVLFYAEVAESQRVHDGGGLVEEGELLETVEISVANGRSFIFDETKAKPSGLMFAFMWFYDQGYDRTR